MTIHRITRMIDHPIAGMAMALLIGALFLPASALGQTEPDATAKSYRHGDRAAVAVPLGDISFADRVVSYEPGSPPTLLADANPDGALGVPDYVDDGLGQFLGLGCRGAVTLQFVDNALFDIAGPDLYVFEIGPDVEPTRLSISADGKNWIEVGVIQGGKAQVDIAAHSKPGQIFRYVRLRDMGTHCDGEWPGADIDAVAALGSGIRYTIAGKILFDTGKAELKPEAREAIAAIAAKISGQRVERVIVVGHTDSQGSAASNQTLSRRRAAAVRDVLGGQSALGNITIAASGAGETEPVATNKTRQGRSANRRVEITLVMSTAAMSGKPAASRKADPQDAPMGVWSGEYHCRSGDPVGTLTWAVTKRGPGSFMIQETYRRGGNQGLGTYRATLDAAGKTLTAVASKGNYSVKMQLDPDGGRMTGRYIGHQNCDTLSMARK